MQALLGEGAFGRVYRTHDERLDHASALSGRTLTGAAGGTPQFMPPEQAAGRRVPAGR